MYTPICRFALSSVNVHVCLTSPSRGLIEWTESLHDPFHGMHLNMFSLSLKGLYDLMNANRRHSKAGTGHKAQFHKMQRALQVPVKCYSFRDRLS